jgi:hypothetical protein
VRIGDEQTTPLREKKSQKKENHITSDLIFLDPVH